MVSIMSHLPNDLIMRIIREADGGRYTHEKKFITCVDDMDELSCFVIHMTNAKSLSNKVPRSYLKHDHKYFSYHSVLASASSNLINKAKSKNRIIVNTNYKTGRSLNKFSYHGDGVGPCCDYDRVINWIRRNLES